MGVGRYVQEGKDMSDKFWREVVIGALAGVILFGLAFAAVPYLEYRNFMNSCVDDDYDADYCHALWREGEK